MFSSLDLNFEIIRAAISYDLLTPVISDPKNFMGSSTTDAMAMG